MLNLMSFSPSNFGRFVSQTEQSSNETNGINERSPPTPPASTINDIPIFLPVVDTPPVSSTNNAQKTTRSSSIIKDDVEPLPFPQHGPGPIQRPNKLACPPTQQPTSSFLANAFQSPGTPDVLYQINHLLDQQNNPTSTSTSTTNVNNPSVPNHDLSATAISWTPFQSTQWASKYDSSWPLTDIQSSPIPLATNSRNPFSMMSTINDQQQQRAVPNEDVTVWSTALGTATPRLISATSRTQRASEWNNIFHSTVPSSTELPKSATEAWLWSVPDPSSTDVVTSNGQETNSNHLVWSLNTLSTEPNIASTIPNPQQVPPTGWWPNATSDENNNTNHLNDDPSNNRDHSRWDFAR